MTGAGSASIWWVIVLLASLPLLWPTSVACCGSGEVAAVRQPDGSVRPDDVHAVAEALDLLALALSSGVPMVVAIEAVAVDAGAEVGAHLSQVSAALRWGVDEVSAWDGLPQVWKPAAAALALAVSAGAPPGDLLRRAAHDIRRREGQRLDEAAGRVGVLIVIPLGLCFLPAFALLSVVPVVASIARSVLAGAT